MILKNAIDKSSKNIYFFLPATSQISAHIKSIEILEPNETTNRECRCQTDVESAVSVEHSWSLLALLGCLLGHQEHGNTRAILGRIEQLFGLEFGQIETFKVRASKHLFI